MGQPGACAISKAPEGRLQVKNIITRGFSCISSDGQGYPVSLVPADIENTTVIEYQVLPADSVENPADHVIAVEIDAFYFFRVIFHRIPDFHNLFVVDKILSVFFREMFRDGLPG